MRIKLCVVFLLAVIVIASAGMGISYANGEFPIDGVVDHHVEFSGVKFGDNEFEKNVGNVEASITGDKKGIDVSVSNAYPGYEAFINFTVMNTGDAPICVSGVSIGDYNTSALSLTLVPDIEGEWLYKCGDMLNGNLTIRVLDDAEQNSQYPFDVTISFSD